MVQRIIQLDEKTDNAVSEAAAENGLSEEAFLSGWIAERIRLEQPGRQTTHDMPPSRPLPPGAGKYSSGRSDISSRDEEILREACEKGQWP